MIIGFIVCLIKNVSKMQRGWVAGSEFGEGVGDVDAISASCEVPCSIGAGCGLACGSHERPDSHWEQISVTRSFTAELVRCFSSAFLPIVAGMATSFLCPLYARSTPSGGPSVKFVSRRSSDAGEIENAVRCIRLHWVSVNLRASRKRLRFCDETGLDVSFEGSKVTSGMTALGLGFYLPCTKVCRFPMTLAMHPVSGYTKVNESFRVCAAGGAVTGLRPLVAS